MRVAILCKWPETDYLNGVAVHVKKIVESLSRVESMEIFILSFGNITKNEHIQNCKIILIKRRIVYYIFPVIPIVILYRELIKTKPDIVHLQGVSLSPYLFAFLLPLKSTKKIITIHSSQIVEKIAQEKIKSNSPFAVSLQLLELLIVNRADLIISVTHKLSKYLNTKIRKSSTKLVVIPNGFDDVLFQPSNKIVPISGELKLTDRFIIFHAKDFLINNGQEYLIRAIPLILKWIPNAILLLAGTGPQKGYLENLCHSLMIDRNVLFLGAIPHSKIPLYMSRADVIVIPSIKINNSEEGSSIFLVEAMAMEKPIIASNIGGLNETILNNETGLLIPDKDPIAIALAVRMLHDNPDFSRRISKQAKKYVDAYRSWKAISNQTYRAYTLIIDNPRSLQSSSSSNSD